MSDVAVIGAGIVGVACALELLRDGHHVTLIEPAQPGGEQAASYGNAGGILPSSIMPMSYPGIWRKVPGWLRDPLGPLTIRWSYLPTLAPWLLRFLRAGASVRRVEATARALRALVADAPQRHRQLAAAAGVPHLIERLGTLYIYPSRADFEAEALAWRIRRDNGVRWLELGADELHQREPSLDRRYQFAALDEEGAHCTDPGSYVAALAAYAEAQGARLVRGNARGFRVEEGRLRAVLLEAGEVACDAAVIAAGARSRKLAKAAGDRVVLETERGYHAMITDPGVTVRHFMMPSDGKMGVNPMRGGLRAAGQVELAGLDAAPNWRRAEIMRDHLRRSFPGLPPDLPPERIKLWMGHRPSTPDGMPVIGRASGCRDVVHAYGHGHIGLMSAPMTGRLVADLVAGRPPVIDPAPYAPQRFQR